jgi:hypothetical protein
MSLKPGVASWRLKKLRTVVPDRLSSGVMSQLSTAPAPPAARRKLTAA